MDEEQRAFLDASEDKLGVSETLLENGRARELRDQIEEFIER